MDALRIETLFKKFVAKKRFVKIIKRLVKTIKDIIFTVI